MTSLNFTAFVCLIQGRQQNSVTHYCVSRIIRFTENLFQVHWICVKIYIPYVWRFCSRKFHPEAHRKLLIWGQDVTKRHPGSPTL